MVKVELEPELLDVEFHEQVVDYQGHVGILVRPRQAPALESRGIGDARLLGPRRSTKPGRIRMAAGLLRRPVRRTKRIFFLDGQTVRKRVPNGLRGAIGCEASRARALEGTAQAAADLRAHLFDAIVRRQAAGTGVALAGALHLDPVMAAAGGFARRAEERRAHDDEEVAPRVD